MNVLNPLNVLGAIIQLIKTQFWKIEEQKRLIIFFAILARVEMGTPREKEGGMGGIAFKLSWFHQWGLAVTHSHSAPGDTQACDATGHGGMPGDNVYIICTLFCYKNNFLRTSSLDFSPTVSTIS